MGIDELSLEELIKKYKEIGDTETDNNKNKEAFKKLFMNKQNLNHFTAACASVMSISTVTGIPLNDVFDMYVDEMKRELESDNTKAIMEIGKIISDLFDDIG